MLTSNLSSLECNCFKVIHPDNPHECNQCQRKFSACLYINELQRKISLQALEIDGLHYALEAKEQEIRHQQTEIQTLHSKHKAGLSLINEIKRQKEIADREIEELSAQLFEEANNMVATEKKKRLQVEKKLSYTEDQLMTEQSQLFELRNKMQSLSTENDSYTSQYYSERHPLSIKLDSTQHVFNDGNESPLDQNEKDITDINQSTLVLADSAHFTSDYFLKSDADIDSFRRSSVQFDHFQKFFDQQRINSRKDSMPSLMSDTSSIEAVEESYPSFFYSSPLQAEYITRSEIEDVDPCLQFGSSQSKICVKTMKDGLSVAPCYIESISQEEAHTLLSPNTACSSVYYKPLWSRISFSADSIPTLACSACECICRDNYYRFRLEEKDDWLLIDQTCRDRLVAVCNFYSFVRNIKLGYYKHKSPREIYLENVHLKLQMFYARVS